MNKTIKIVTILLIALMVLSIGTTCFADAKGDITAIDGKVDRSGVDTGTIETFGAKIIKVIRVVAYIVTLVVLAVLAIRYIMGSAEQKAEYKKSFIPFIVGLLILSGGVTVVGWILEQFKIV